MKVACDHIPEFCTWFCDVRLLSCERSAVCDGRWHLGDRWAGLRLHAAPGHTKHDLWYVIMKLNYALTALAPSSSRQRRCEHCCPPSSSPHCDNCSRTVCVSTRHAQHTWHLPSTNTFMHAAASHSLANDQSNLVRILHLRLLLQTLHLPECRVARYVRDS